MKMKMRPILLLLFISSVLNLCFAQSQSQLGITVEKCVGDTSIFTVDSGDLSCEDGYCMWGSKGTVSGTYTIGSSLSTTSPVVTASLFGLSFFNHTVDICDGGKVSNDNGSYCPTVGTYEFNTDIDLPGSPNSWYVRFSSWLSLTVAVDVDFGDATVDCYLKIEGYNPYNYTNASMVVSSAVLIVGLFAYKRNKHRRVLSKDDFEDPKGNFVEMSGVESC